MAKFDLAQKKSKAADSFVAGADTHKPERTTTASAPRKTFPLRFNEEQEQRIEESFKRSTYKSKQEMFLQLIMSNLP